MASWMPEETLMTRYMVLWKANASAWPTDPKGVLGMWEAAAGGGDHLLSAGALKDLGWFSGEEGYAIFEAESKAAVMGMIQPFFPFFSQDLREMVPWADGKHAILASAQQAASR
jgi:hypothetical protein